MTITSRRAARRQARDEYALVSGLARAWRWTAEGTALCREVPCVAGGVVSTVPEVVGVDLGPPITLTVRLLAGQLATDVAEVAPRLAEGMGMAAVRVEPWRYGHILVTLLPVDPLTLIPAPRGNEDSPSYPINLGHGEDGRPVVFDPGVGGHMVVQGATGSGKSTGLYSVLGQLAHLPHVEVTGCDPTGLLMAPWTGRSGLITPSLGTGNPAGHVAVLEALTSRMDGRISAIRPGRDAVDLGPDCPLVVVVLEEYPGLLRVLDGADKALGKLTRAAVARLLSEGRKAGVRVVLVAQRAEANVIGGFERGQCSHRISFRVDTADAVKMLHPDVSPDLVAEHAVAPPGIGLLTAPGVPLLRFRAPHSTYSDYVAAVQNGATP